MKRTEYSNDPKYELGYRDGSADGFADGLGGKSNTPYMNALSRDLMTPITVMKPKETGLYLVIAAGVWTIADYSLTFDAWNDGRTDITKSVTHWIHISNKTKSPA